MDTKELIDRIFKEPGIQFELTEFDNLGKLIHEIISIYPKAATTGKDAGKTKYYLKSLIPFSSGNEEVQVYVEGRQVSARGDRPSALGVQSCFTSTATKRMRLILRKVFSSEPRSAPRRQTSLFMPMRVSRRPK